MHNKSSKNGSERFWPTPDANSKDRGGRLENGHQSGRSLKALVCIPTSSPSTDPTTPASISSQVDFLASHSPSPGSVEARKMTVRSGRKCLELFPKRNPLGSLVKTLLVSSRWNSTISFLTWKASATPRGRLLFRLVPSMPDTDATEFGLWPTPRSGKTTDETEESWTARRDAGKVSTPPLTLAVKMWPTPTANEDACGKSTGKMQAMLGNHPDIGKDKTAGSLSAHFVEFLMGYPKDWTAVENFASGRTKTRKPQESPPESSTAPTGSGDSETPSSRKSRKKSSKT